MAAGHNRVQRLIDRVPSPTYGPEFHMWKAWALDAHSGLIRLLAELERVEAERDLYIAAHDGPSGSYTRARRAEAALAREQARAEELNEILRALIAGDLTAEEANVALAAKNWNARLASIAAAGAAAKEPADERICTCGYGETGHSNDERTRDHEFKDSGRRRSDPIVIDRIGDLGS